jgi:hypothetical protein
MMLPVGAMSFVKKLPLVLMNVWVAELCRRYPLCEQVGQRHGAVD